MKKILTSFLCVFNVFLLLSILAFSVCFSVSEKVLMESQMEFFLEPGGMIAFDFYGNKIERDNLEKEFKDYILDIPSDIPVKTYDEAMLSLYHCDSYKMGKEDNDNEVFVYGAVNGMHNVVEDMIISEVYTVPEGQIPAYVSTAMMTHYSIGDKMTIKLNGDEIIITVAAFLNNNLSFSNIENITLGDYLTSTKNTVIIPYENLFYEGETTRLCLPIILITKKIYNEETGDRENDEQIKYTGDFLEKKSIAYSKGPVFINDNSVNAAEFYSKSVYYDLNIKLKNLIALSVVFFFFVELLLGCQIKRKSYIMVSIVTAILLLIAMVVGSVCLATSIFSSAAGTFATCFCIMIAIYLVEVGIQLLIWHFSGGKKKALKRRFSNENNK